jgi:predicted nuclease of predicted toxin-antitoxin system
MAVVDVAPGAADVSVIGLAVQEDRIFVTEDRDFGQLVYATAKPARGVILVRFPSTVRSGLPALMVEIVAQHGDKLRERFTVIQPGRVRFGIIPRD